jgi:hypothetical protein
MEMGESGAKDGGGGREVGVTKKVQQKGPHGAGNILYLGPGSDIVLWFCKKVPLGETE